MSQDPSIPTNSNAPAHPDSGANKRRQMLLKGPILRTLMRLSLPVIAVVSAQTFVAVLEAYWVSRLGTAAVAGVSVVIPLYVLMNTMSNGGIGGGVSSAISRALGARNTSDADAILLHTIVIALAFGLTFAAAWAAFGRLIALKLGATGEALHFASVYANWIFFASPLVWVVNLMASAMRGAGEVRLPAIVSLAGAIVLLPLCPALIFGFGPLPALGVAGAGAATFVFYLSALAVYWRHLRSGRGTLRLQWVGLSRHIFREILGVGLVSALGTLVASLTVIALTGAVGRYGVKAMAGYGIASRVDALIVPLLFGLGSGVVTLVGIATGAGDHQRADHVTFRSSALAFLASGAVGAAFALVPRAWMATFTADPQVQDIGTTYFHIVAPFYAAFGLGLTLYFASQGRSRMLWPFLAGAARLLATVVGAYFLSSQGRPLADIFAVAAAGNLLFGGINFAGLLASRRRNG